MSEPTEDIVSHGMRNYNLCRAVDGNRLSMALDDIKAAGADPELVRMGEVLIKEGRQLIILANDRVGDGNRICTAAAFGGEPGEFQHCGLKHNHAGPCDLPLGKNRG